MKNKILGLFVLSVLALTLIVGAVSAVTLSSWALTSNGNAVADSQITASTLSSNLVTLGTFGTNGVSVSGWPTGAISPNNYVQVSLTANSGSNLQISAISFDHLTNFIPNMNFNVQVSKDANFSSPINISTGVSSTNISASNSVTLSLPIAVNSGETLYLRIFGYNSLNALNTFSIKNLVISGDFVPQKVADCTLTGTQAGTNNNHISVSVDSVSVDSGFGDESNWFPLDTIKARVNVENNGNERIRNIEVNWGLWSKSTQKWVVSGKESTFSLKSGDNQNVNLLNFKIDNVNKLKDGRNFVFYAWAKGEDQTTSPLTNVCKIDSSTKVDSVIESDFVVLDNIQTIENPNYAQCGKEATISADVWNIGDSDEDKVYILADSPLLGLVSKRVDMGSISSMSSSKLNFPFVPPQGIDERTYPVQFTIYDRHDNVFKANFNSKKAIFKTVVDIKGNCFTVGKATITAGLQSDAVEGKPLVIKSVITNSGTKSAQYIVSPEGYSAWASSASVDVPTFSLDAGQSKEVTITLQAKQGSMGEQTFDVKVLSGNQVVMTQPVSVLVSRAGFLSAITGNAIGGTSSLWIVGALNVILVFAIIIIAIRFFRK